jgi:CBS-domain-containing membrane protein
MKVSEIMTRRVISITPEATLLNAIRLMLKHHISGLPVIDHDHRLVGIVTESDFLHRAETATDPRRSWLYAIFEPIEAAEGYVRSHGMKIRDIMTKQVVTASEQTPLEEVVHLLEVQNIKRLPVMRDHKVVGIVTRTNLMHAFVSIHRGMQKSSETDASLREHIMREVDHHSWAVGAHVDVMVRNGLADLWGTISDLEQRNALRQLVEDTPGVKIVVDHLRWQDATSPT